MQAMVVVVIILVLLSLDKVLMLIRMVPIQWKIIPTREMPGITRAIITKAITQGITLVITLVISQSITLEQVEAMVMDMHLSPHPTSIAR